MTLISPHLKELYIYFDQTRGYAFHFNINLSLIFLKKWKA